MTIRERRRSSSICPGMSPLSIPKTGKEIWRCKGLSCLAYTQPLVSKDFIVAMSGYGGPTIGRERQHPPTWRYHGNQPALGQREKSAADRRGRDDRRRVYLINTPGIAECLIAATGKNRVEEPSVGSRRGVRHCWWTESCLQRIVRGRPWCGRREISWTCFIRMPLGKKRRLRWCFPMGRYSSGRLRICIALGSETGRTERAGVTWSPKVTMPAPFSTPLAYHGYCVTGFVGFVESEPVMELDVLPKPKTEVGSYFVANYPPFSVWTPEHKPEILAAL